MKYGSLFLRCSIGSRNVVGFLSQLVYPLGMKILATLIASSMVCGLFSKQNSFFPNVRFAILAFLCVSDQINFSYPL